MNDCFGQKLGSYSKTEQHYSGCVIRVYCRYEVNILVLYEPYIYIRNFAQKIQCHLSKIKDVISLDLF